MRFAFNSVALGLALFCASCARDRARPAQSEAAARAASGGAAPSGAISIEERQQIKAWLSFISERDQDLEVYAVHPSGAPERRLTRRRGGDYNGPTSPDGTQLLITSVHESPASPIKVQRLNLLALPDSLAQGAGMPAVSALGPPRTIVRHPSWSADGQSIVFEGDSSGYRDLFRIRRDGSALQQLTNNPEGNFEPSLSPRGDFIVFVSSRDRAAEIYRARLDGSAAQRLTQTVRDEWSPRFSADGTRLVFASDRDGADRLYLSHADGSQVQRVSDIPLDSNVIEEAPRFSPQGSLLAYVVRKRGERGNLFILDIATGTRRQVGAELALDLGEPAWSPDSRYLAFSANRDQNMQIHLARSDGSGAVRITSSAGPNWNPQWITARPNPQ